MQRRKLLLATGGALTTVTAGCLGTGSESEPTAQSDVDVEVEFFLDDGDLVAGHISGDVLESGQSVYITIAGDQVAEKTLSTDVHTGGEIMRVTDVKDEFGGQERVGLYLQGSDGSEEIAVATVTISRSHIAPSAQIDFDYTASNGELIIAHDGGATLNPDNTGTITVTGSSLTEADITWNAPVTESGTSATVDGTVGAGDSIVTVSNVTDSGETLEFVWEGPNGNNSQALGSFEAP